MAKSMTEGQSVLQKERPQNKKISFDDNWICYEAGKREKAFEVSVPHDAMLLDERSEKSTAGVKLGWYVAKDYTYEKVFLAPGAWRG